MLGHFSVRAKAKIISEKIQKDREKPVLEIASAPLCISQHLFELYILTKSNKYITVVSVVSVFVVLHYKTAAQHHPAASSTSFEAVVKRYGSPPTVLVGDTNQFCKALL